MSFVVGVSHCKADPLRVAHLKAGKVPADFIEDTPGHHSVWAPKMWDTALRSGKEHCVFFQDDVSFLAPGLAQYCTDDIVCLHSPHPRFKAVFDAGYSWATSIDGMVGNGYVVPRVILAEFLAFRQDEMWPEVLTELNEDAQIALFVMATGRKIWHPLPSPIDHDTTIPSTWGADHHAHRKPCVPWESRRGERRKEGSVCVGRIYPKEHWRLVTHLRHPRVREAYRLSNL